MRGVDEVFELAVNTVVGAEEQGWDGRGTSSSSGKGSGGGTGPGKRKKRSCKIL